jgi:cytochrome c
MFLTDRNGKIHGPSTRLLQCPLPERAARFPQEPSMKSLSLVAAAAMFAFTLPASAAVDADAANKALKDNGCTKCHSVDKSKKGPAFKKVAADMKGKPDAEAKLATFLTTGPKVKMDDGTEEEHKAIKDTAVVKNLVQFILAQ